LTFSRLFYSYSYFYFYSYFYSYSHPYLNLVILYIYIHLIIYVFYGFYIFIAMLINNYKYKLGRLFWQPAEEAQSLEYKRLSQMYVYKVLIKFMTFINSQQLYWVNYGVNKNLLWAKIQPRASFLFSTSKFRIHKWSIIPTLTSMIIYNWVSCQVLVITN
jgi:hypothetical protein